MARPQKLRRICSQPACTSFGPLSGHYTETLSMTLDEYETIRLMDIENLSQEECALRMNVARTTVQAIYTNARKKLGELLVHQKRLQIEGGQYKLYKEDNMKIAVTYENGQVFGHFGHTEQFKIYTIEGNTVKDAEVVDTNGVGHGSLAGFLQENGVTTLICGGIGGGARVALADANIELFPGAFGDADCAVNALLGGNLVYDPNTTCNHHGEGHQCSGHGHEHGQHKCGQHSK